VLRDKEVLLAFADAVLVLPWRAHARQGAQ
jgi:hypothetical protein